MKGDNKLIDIIKGFLIVYFAFSFVATFCIRFMTMDYGVDADHMNGVSLTVIYKDFIVYLYANTNWFGKILSTIILIILFPIGVWGYF